MTLAMQETSPRSACFRLPDDADPAADRLLSAFPSGTNPRDMIFVLANPIGELDDMSPIE